jgi:hypothetical protein
MIVRFAKANDSPARMLCRRWAFLFPAFVNCLQHRGIVQIFCRRLFKAAGVIPFSGFSRVLRRPQDSGRFVA